MLITANQPFAEWNKVFPGPSMTIAAVDRLVHHSVVVEMNVESYRQKAATTRRRGRATIKNDNQTTSADGGKKPDYHWRSTFSLPATIWRDNHQTKRRRITIRIDAYSPP